VMLGSIKIKRRLLYVLLVPQDILATSLEVLNVFLVC
jgi:hypothetical protein